MVVVKRLLLVVALLSSAAAVALPAPAGAAAPCRNKVFNDWYQDGKIASTFPVACYRDALKHIPLDADIYSSLKDDIRAALRAAIRRSHGLSAPRIVGKGFDTLTGSGGVKGKVVPISKRSPHDPSPVAVAPVATVADSSGGVPLPILVLGGIAIALVAAGAIGLGVRHARNRPPSTP
jgi:hypothetical protein